MTQKEFQDRTNIAVIEEMFWNLNEVYLTVAQDKNEFCDIVRVMHGANPACLDFLCHLGYKIRAEREETEARTKALLAQYDERTDALQAENDDMKEFIYSHSEYPTHMDMEEKAIQLLGKAEYCARCLEDGRDLPADGIKYVTELLRKEGRK